MKYASIKKDILTDSGWLSVSEKDIFVFKDLDISWKRKQWETDTYKVSFSLTNFENKTFEITLYKEFDKMDYVNECNEYIKTIIRFIEV